MRALVTGAAGFIGSHLCEALARDGHDVVGLDAFIPYYRRAVKEANLSAAGDDRFVFVEADLRTDDLRPHLERVDAVVHLAAMPGLARSWTDIELYSSCNVVATARLVEACRLAGVGRFVQVSTSSVYGSDAMGDEAMPLRPASPYGVTKLAAEHLVLANVEQFDFPALILRYFSIYGPRQRPDMGYHIFSEALLDDAPIVLFGDGSQTRSNTYIDDCVQGTVLALANGRLGEAYNIGGGAVVSVLEAIEVLAAEAGVRPRIVHTDPRPGDQRATRANCDKAADHFGYRALVAPAEGLARQFAWHRERRSRSSFGDRGTPPS
ncbi:MAG TPA: NAD-dependent epimerase/dehydratase family protein [Ilumatobacteraceae bacterium]|jgi:UDP-glucuronate 4-epimerase